MVGDDDKIQCVPLELWNSGSLELWNSRTLELWNSGTFLSGNSELKIPTGIFRLLLHPVLMSLLA